LDFDERGETRSSISEGWKGVYSLWGLIATGAGIAVAKRLGVDILQLEQQPASLLAAKAIALVCALANLVSWTSNPNKDLETLQEWLTTMPNRYRTNNAQRWLIILQMILVVSICVATLWHPLYVGLFGVLTYMNNIAGFIIIEGRVRKALEESRQLSQHLAPKIILSYLREGYDCIESWWGCDRSFARNRMQIRHSLIVAGFALTAVIGFWARLAQSRLIETLGYYAATLTLAGAVISITILRTIRDERLANIETRWSETMLKKRIAEKIRGEG
jgi:hypothetical protein